MSSAPLGCCQRGPNNFAFVPYSRWKSCWKSENGKECNLIWNCRGITSSLMCLARRLETFTPDWNWQLAVRNSKPSVVFLHSSWQLQNAALKEGSQERNLPALVSSDLLSFRASSVQSKTCCRRVCKRRCISKRFLYCFFFRIFRIFCCEHQCSWFVIRCSTIGSVAPTSKLVSHEFQSEKDIFSNLQRSSATAKSASYPFGPPHTAMAQAPPGWPNSLELPSSRRNMDKHLRRHDTSWYVESSYVRFESSTWAFSLELLEFCICLGHRSPRSHCSDRPVARASQVFLCAFDKPETWKGFSDSKQSYVYSWHSSRCSPVHTISKTRLEFALHHFLPNCFRVLGKESTESTRQNNDLRGHMKILAVALLKSQPVLCWVKEFILSNQCIPQIV